MKLAVKLAPTFLLEVRQLYRPAMCCVLCPLLVKVYAALQMITSILQGYCKSIRTLEDIVVSQCSFAAAKHCFHTDAHGVNITEGLLFVTAW